MNEYNAEKYGGRKPIKKCDNPYNRDPKCLPKAASPPPPPPSPPPPPKRKPCPIYIRNCV